MTDSSRGVSKHVDARGTLLAVELTQTPFEVQRIFTVTAPGTTVHRGNHSIDYRELIVLVSGRVTVHVTPDEGAPSTTVIQTPGETLLVEPHAFIEYTLDGPSSTILVLADKPFAG